MEPRIQYAQTADGVNIAFYTLGEGVPLVYLPAIPFSHIQQEWKMDEWRKWFERLAQRRMLVAYDGRGSGLSERGVSDYSLDGHVRDLQAVVDRLGLESFALFGSFHSGPVAIAYAARNPERVSRLILWCSYPEASKFMSSPEAKALRRLVDSWDDYTEAIAHKYLGWSRGRLGNRYAEWMRNCVTQEVAIVIYRAIRKFKALAPQVHSPTLVLHRRQLHLPDISFAAKLAAQIPDAGLILLEGESGAPWLERMQTVARVVDEFLGGEGEPTADGESVEASAFRTVLFTDVEGSTALTERLGDARAREVLREHERIVREALKAHGGSELKTTGDGFMASSSSATRALESAIAMQRAFAAHNESAEEPILVRVGLNAGEPIAEDEDLFGTAVNLAARIAAEAQGGEILVSATVRGLVAGKKFVFADRGDHDLKGFGEPVRLYEVRWRKSTEEGDLSPSDEPRFTVVARSPVDNWVHVAVENNGPTADFVAQVTAVEGAEQTQTVPWPIKWRGWEGEDRTIVEGQTQLLDLAEGDLLHDAEAPSWEPGVFWFHSTTARFPVRLAGLKTDDDLYEKTMRVVVRVSTVSPTRSVTKTVHLGFDRSTKPRVQMD